MALSTLFKARWLAIAMLLAGLQSCGNPVDIDTPRRLTRVNLDSVVVTLAFLGAPGDSIFAYLGETEVIFATAVERPLFYNRKLPNGHFVTVRATRYGLNRDAYEIMSLRLDAVRDTGTYIINAPYSQPKQIEPDSVPLYGATYDRRNGRDFPESYRAGNPGTSGEIRVVKIDEDRGVMVGTFRFTGYSAEKDSIITVSNGAFRLQLKKD